MDSIPHTRPRLQSQATVIKDSIVALIEYIEEIDDGNRVVLVRRCSDGHFLLQARWSLAVTGLLVTRVTGLLIIHRHRLPRHTMS